MVLSSAFMALDSNKSSAADNQQEIPWIVENRDLLEETKKVRAKVARSHRYNKEIILTLLGQICDTAMGIDVLTSEQGREHIDMLIKTVNHRFSPFSDYLYP